MKIVVLDGHTLNPGDLSWDGLHALGEVTIFERTLPELLVERAKDAEILIVNKVIVDAALLDQLPKLRYIGVTATGYNIVDTAACAGRNIPVTNVPAYSTASVAQLVFALLFELTQQVAHHDRLVKAGRWSTCPDFCFWDKPLVELDGLTLGIVGFGQIGRRVATIGQAFGMRVSAHTAHPENYRDTTGVSFVTLDELFTTSDVITLHCPLTPATAQLINADRLQQMKTTARLINTGRGPLIDEAALAAALNAGRIAGAGCDVLSTEPPTKDNPLLTARNCVVTPHIAWATGAARQRLMEVVVANVRAFIAGTTQNRVN